MSKVEIILNGERRSVPESITIEELIAKLGLSGQAVAVEQNHAIVARQRRADTMVSDGDTIEIVHFVGGG